MNESILKSHWERLNTHIELDLESAQKILSPYTHDKIQSLTLLSDGCANTNYKITFQNEHAVVIRIYTRAQSALMLETGIHKLVHTVLPVADYLYTDDTCTNYPHPYAIIKWVNGILMRDLIFQRDEDAIQSAARDAGQHLGILRAMKLPLGGFFQENMQIRPFAPEEEYETYIMHLLQDKTVADSLGKNLRHDLAQIVSECCHLIPQINDANLTHGDYDPANILVHEMNGSWKVAAILDWEFALSATYLLDIGTMLRYSHKLPACFEASFIHGIEDIGPPLPADWKKQAKLMDILCLLQLLHNNPAAERPYLNRDVTRLITHTAQTLPRL